MKKKSIEKCIYVTTCHSPKTELEEYFVFMFRKYIRDNKLTDNYIPSYRVFMCKAALEFKFNREFSLKEIQDIMKDTSWQHKSTLSQTPNDLEDRTETHVSQ